MKALKIIFTSLIIGSATLSFAQLPNGSVAPNFTLVDISGTQHTLYDYLEQGKTVYIDFFACHCPYCWNYHSTHALSNLYDSYGPGTASDSVFVFAIELDANNSTNEFYGISGQTQGNWVEGTNYPQINPEGTALNTIVSDFAVNYYPLIYAICPDKTITVIGTKTTQELYNHTTTCQVLSAPSPIMEQRFNISSDNQFLKIQINDFEAKSDVEFQLLDINGRILKKIQAENSFSQIKIEDLQSGIYLLGILENDNLILATKIQK